MGMTIEEAINHLGNYSSTNGSGLTTDEQHNEAKRVAKDTMRKYQKIQAIAEKCNLKLLPKEGMSTFMKDVLEVLEDGKID